MSDLDTELQEHEDLAAENRRLREDLRVIKEFAISQARQVEESLNQPISAQILWAFWQIRDRTAKALETK